MKPSQVATQLRRIAAKIEKSSQPDKSLVVKEIKNLVKRVAATNFSGDNIRVTLENAFENFDLDSLKEGESFIFGGYEPLDELAELGITVKITLSKGKIFIRVLGVHEQDEIAYISKKSEFDPTSAAKVTTADMGIA